MAARRHRRRGACPDDERHKEDNDQLHDGAVHARNARIAGFSKTYLTALYLTGDYRDVQSRGEAPAFARDPLKLPVIFDAVRLIRGIGKSQITIAIHVRSFAADRTRR
ncbi:hypothetical protein [Shinella zoogloeoides]|uniref:Uncharacterized protein n=1 Tax=Shinella zoogloeoides TaxID=352475 RepID=A0A6N8TI87_SHIZO|nr:hypothetical protein [Shinella zoogloeoides]MXO01936.1 hypothetical protein [Shinella zoogloeoides]UEX84483.1 hypothetical protein K8M09_22985 [Shinella zoogloeoides]